MRKLLSLVVLFLAFLVSCKKSKSNNEQQTENRDNILNENCHVIDTIAIKDLTFSSITLDKSSLGYNPIIGDILIASPSTRDTLGVLIKITSIITNGNELICGTEPSNLNDAFKQLFIDEIHSDSYSGSSQHKPTGTGSHFVISFDNTVNIAAGFKMSGNLNLNFPELRLKYTKIAGDILPDTILVAQDFNTDGSNLEFKANALQVDTKVIDSFVNLPVIDVVVPIGGVPLIIPFYQKVKLNILPLTISGKMKFTVHPKISATLGASFINGDWKNLSTYAVNSNADSLNEEDFDAEMEASLTIFNPEYALNPYGSDAFGIYFKVPYKFQAKIQKTSPNYSLKYSLEVEASIKVNFWTGLLESEIVAHATLIEKIIMEGNWKYHIGDTVLGGVIFYLDSTRRHGMICAMNDQSSNSLFTPNNNIPPLGQLTFRSEIGYGAINTNNIISVWGASNNIGFICKNYTDGNYNDWFLPSQDELNQLYLNKDSVKVITSGIYWSSTAYNSPNIPYDCIAQDFLTGELSGLGNPPQTVNFGQSYHVRATRKF
jgi:hypothetical protein